MARKKSGSGSISALAAKAVEEVKRGRPKGSKNKSRKKMVGSACTNLSELKRAVDTIKKVKGYIAEVDRMGVISRKK